MSDEKMEANAAKLTENILGLLRTMGKVSQQSSSAIISGTKNFFLVQSASMWPLVQLAEMVKGNGARAWPTKRTKRTE